MTRRKLRELYAPNPPALFPNGLERSQIARIEDMPGRFGQLAFFQGLPGVAAIDGDELQHTRITVAVNHAARATVPNKLRIVPFPNFAHRLLPIMTAIKVEVPVQIEIFVPTQATKFFLFAAQMPLHFGERLHGINDWKMVVAFQVLDLLE